MVTRLRHYIRRMFTRLRLRAWRLLPPIGLATRIMFNKCQALLFGYITPRYNVSCHCCWSVGIVGWRMVVTRSHHVYVGRLAHADVNRSITRHVTRESTLRDIAQYAVDGDRGTLYIAREDKARQRYARYTGYSMALVITRVTAWTRYG